MNFEGAGGSLILRTIYGGWNTPSRCRVAYAVSPDPPRMSPACRRLHPPPCRNFYDFTFGRVRLKFARTNSVSSQSRMPGIHLHPPRELLPRGRRQRRFEIYLRRGIRDRSTIFRKNKRIVFWALPRLIRAEPFRGRNVLRARRGVPQRRYSWYSEDKRKTPTGDLIPRTTAEAVIGAFSTSKRNPARSRERGRGARINHLYNAGRE